MILADTGAIICLLDANDPQHHRFRSKYQENAEEWVLPCVILPEVDYLLSAHFGPRTQDAFFADLASGNFSIEPSTDEDLVSAYKVHTKYRSLRLGFVDAMVIAAAERLKPDAIATLDLRHFGTVAIKGNPRLFPRDW